MHLGFDQVIAVDAIDHFFQMLITRRLTISIIYSSLYISFTCLSKTLNFSLVDVRRQLSWPVRVNYDGRLGFLIFPTSSLF